MHIVVTGGGTGGHVYPALEIAKAFIEHERDIKVTFVGNKNSFEERMAKKAGLRFFAIKTKQFIGHGLLYKLFSLYVLFFAVISCLGFLLKEKPKAIIGVGGYVSAPMLIAGFFLRIPRFIAEQNATPGLTNKVMGKISNLVFTSFQESSQYFPRVLLTGNPVRAAFFVDREKRAIPPLRILISGGTQGAQFLNNEVPRALAIVKEAWPDIKITHQTGHDKLGLVREYYKRENINAEVLPFIDDMPQAFLHHDVIISRAGATVVAEIKANGIAAILVPYRFADGHQKANAEALINNQAAIMIEEDENFIKILAATLKQFYLKPEQLLLMGQKARALAKDNASELIVETVLKYIK